MNRTTRSRHVLGASALMLGLLGLSVGGAQAETGAKWMVGGTDAGTLKAGIQVVEISKNKEQEEKKEVAKLTLKTKIGGAEVKFATSTTPELISIKLEGEGKLTTGGKAKFTGVTTELNGKASAVCMPLGTAGSDATLGIITTNKVKGELVLHESTGVIQIKPETGNVFWKFFFGEECSLPSEVSVITKKEVKLTVEGKEVLDKGNGLVLKEPLGKLGTEELTHEFTELPALTELWVISETEEHKKVVEGTVKAGLTSPHSAFKWKGIPG